MVATRPFVDALPVFRGWRGPEHDQQLLFLVVLNEFAISQSAAKAGAVQFILAVHPRRRTSRNQQEARKSDSSVDPHELLCLLWEQECGIEIGNGRSSGVAALGDALDHIGDLLGDFLSVVLPGLVAGLHFAEANRFAIPEAS